MTFPAQLENWFVAHPELARIGAVFARNGRVTDPRDERPDFAEVSVENDARFVEVLVWESGEVEFGFGPFDDQTDEHHEVGSTAELNEILERFLHETQPIRER